MSRWAEYRLKHTTGRPLRAGLFFVLLGSVPGHASALAYESTSWLHAEPQPWSDYFGDWQSALDEGSDGVARSVHRLSNPAIAPNWRLGIEFERQMTVSANRDAALIYWTIKQDRDLPVGSYHPRLQLREIETQSLYLQARWQFANWRISPRLRLSRARRLLDGRIGGELIQTSEHSDLDWGITMTYHQDPLFGRPAQANWGHGPGLDVRLQWQNHQGLSADLDIEHALSLVYFHRAQWTRARLRAELDRLGRLDSEDTSPLISGQEGRGPHWQQLPAHIRLHVEQAIGRTHLLLRWQHFAGAHQAQIGLRLGLRQASMGLAFDPWRGHLSLLAAWSRFEVELSSDHWQQDRASHTLLKLRVLGLEPTH